MLDNFSPMDSISRSIISYYNLCVNFMPHRLLLIFAFLHSMLLLKCHFGCFITLGIGSEECSIFRVHCVLLEVIDISGWAPVLFTTTSKNCVRLCGFAEVKSTAYYSTRQVEEIFQTSPHAGDIFHVEI